MINHNVTLLKASREEWRKIESEETAFTLREFRPPYETMAFIFIDAGEHFIVSTLTFGGLEHVRQAYRNDSSGTQRTVEAYPPSEYEICKIRPISDNELLQRLCDE